MKKLSVIPYRGKSTYTSSSLDSWTSWAARFLEFLMHNVRIALENRERKLRSRSSLSRGGFLGGRSVFALR